MKAADAGADITPSETRHGEFKDAHEIMTDVVIDDEERSHGPALVTINKPSGVDVSGFFNVDNPDDPVPAIVLRRVLQDGREIFQLERPIGYWDAHVGGIIVPHNMASFFTDLTSVPQLLTWLIPKTGRHLPAALLHDGLVLGPDEPQTYVASRTISRVEADRIFRDAMKDVKTPGVTRWLVWATVAAATKTRKQSSTLVASQNWLGWFVVGGTALIIATLGTLATLELFDCVSLIPGLAEQSTVVNLAVGAGAAVVAPTLLSAFWGREWRAGIILGVAISLLLHLMVAVLVVFGVFRSADCLTAGRYARSALWLGVSAAVVGAIAALIVLVCN